MPLQSDANIFFRDFVNLCADSFASGHPLEGVPDTSHLVTYLVTFFADMQPFIEAYFGSGFDIKTLPASHALRDLFKERHNLHKAISDSISYLRQEGQKPSELLQKVRTLGKGKSLFLSGGWIGSPGHALLYQFINVGNDCIEFRVINTGGGTGAYHQSVWQRSEEEAPRRPGKVRYHPLTYVMPASLLNAKGVDKQFIAFIESIKAQREDTHTNRYDKEQDGGQYLYENILWTITLWGKGQTDIASPTEKDYTLNAPGIHDILPVTNQHGSTCAGRSALQTVKNQLSQSQYRWFKLLLFYRLCEEFIYHMEKLQSDCDSLQKILPNQMSRIRLVRSVLGNLGRYGLLKKIQEKQSRLNEKLNQLHQRVNKLASDLMYKAKYREPREIQRLPPRDKWPVSIKGYFQQPGRSNRHFMPPIEREYVYEHPEEEKESPTLLVELRRIAEIIEEKSSNLDPYSTVRAIENTLFDLIYADDDRLRFNKADHLETCIDCLHTLYILYGLQYEACSKTGQISPAQCIGCMGFLFLISRIAQANKQYVSHYFSVYLPYYLKHFIKKNANGYLCSGSPQHDYLLHHMMHTLHDIKKNYIFFKSNKLVGEDDSKYYFLAYQDLVTRIFTEEEQRTLIDMTDQPLCPDYPELASFDELKPYFRCKQIINTNKQGAMPTTFRIQTCLESLLDDIYDELTEESITKQAFSVQKDNDDNKYSLQAPTYPMDDYYPHELLSTITAFRGTLTPDEKDVVGKFRGVLFDASYHLETSLDVHFHDKHGCYYPDKMLSPHGAGWTLLQCGRYDSSVARMKKLWLTKFGPSTQDWSTVSLFADGHPDFFLQYPKLLEMNLFGKYVFVRSLIQHGPRTLDKLNAFLRKTVTQYMNNTDPLPVFNAIKMLVFANHYALQTVHDKHITGISKRGDKEKTAIIASALNTLRAVTPHIEIMVKVKQGTSFPFGTLSAYRAMLSALEIVYGDPTQLPTHWEQFLIHQMDCFTRDMLTEHDTGAFFMLRQTLLSDMCSKIAAAKQIFDPTLSLTQIMKKHGLIKQDEVCTLCFKTVLMGPRGTKEKAGTPRLYLNLETGHKTSPLPLKHVLAPRTLKQNAHFQTYFSDLGTLPLGTLSERESTFLFSVNAHTYRFSKAGVNAAWQDAALQCDFHSIFPDSTTPRWYQLLPKRDTVPLLKAWGTVLLPLVHNNSCFWRDAKGDIVVTQAHQPVYVYRKSSKFLFPIKQDGTIQRSPIIKDCHPTLALFENAHFTYRYEAQDEQHDKPYVRYVLPRYDLTVQEENNKTSPPWTLIQKNGEKQRGSLSRTPVSLPYVGFIFTSPSDKKNDKSVCQYYVPLQSYCWRKSQHLTAPKAHPNGLYPPYLAALEENAKKDLQDQLPIDRILPLETDNKARYCVYTLDKAGRLVMDTTEKGLYVVYLYFMEGRYETANTYLDQLRETPFLLNTHSLQMMALFLKDNLEDGVSSPPITLELLTIRLKALAYMIDAWAFSPCFTWPPEQQALRASLPGTALQLYLDYLRLIHNRSVNRVYLSHRDSLTIANYLFHRTKQKQGQGRCHPQYHFFIKQQRDFLLHIATPTHTLPSTLTFLSGGTSPKNSNDPMARFSGACFKDEFWQQYHKSAVRKVIGYIPYPTQHREQYARAFDALLSRQGDKILPYLPLLFDIKANENANDYRFQYKADLMRIVNAEYTRMSRCTVNSHPVTLACFLLKNTHLAEYLSAFQHRHNECGVSEKNDFCRFFEKICKANPLPEDRYDMVYRPAINALLSRNEKNILQYLPDLFTVKALKDAPIRATLMRIVTREYKQIPDYPDTLPMCAIAAFLLKKTDYHTFQEPFGNNDTIGHTQLMEFFNKIVKKHPLPKRRDDKNKLKRDEGDKEEEKKDDNEDNTALTQQTSLQDLFASRHKTKKPLKCNTAITRLRKQLANHTQIIAAYRCFDNLALAIKGREITDLQAQQKKLSQLTCKDIQGLDTKKKLCADLTTLIQGITFAAAFEEAASACSQGAYENTQAFRQAVEKLIDLLPPKYKKAATQALNTACLTDCKPRARRAALRGFFTDYGDWEEACIDERGGHILYQLIKQKQSLVPTVEHDQFLEAIKHEGEELDKQREVIEADIKQRWRNYKKQETSLKQSGWDEGKTFSIDWLIRQWQHDDLQTVRTAYGLKKEDIPYFKEQLLQYLRCKTEAQHMARVEQKYKKEENKSGTVRLYAACFKELMQDNLCQYKHDLDCLLLYFQYKKNLLVRKEQWVAMRRMVLHQDTSNIQQLLMGAGKSSVIVLFVSLLQSKLNKKMMLSCVPKALMEDNKFVRAYQNLTGKPVHKFVFDRHFTGDFDELLSHLSIAHQQGEALVTCSSALFSLTLKLLEILDKPPSRKQQQAVSSIVGIMRLLDSSSFILVDEIHNEFRANLDLNYGLSKPQSIDEALISAMTDLLSQFFVHARDTQSKTRDPNDFSFVPFLKHLATSPTTTFFRTGLLDEVKRLTGNPNPLSCLTDHITGKNNPKKNQDWVSKLPTHAQTLLKLLILLGDTHCGLLHKLDTVFHAERYGLSGPAKRLEALPFNQLLSRRETLPLVHYIAVPYSGVNSPKSGSQFANIGDIFLYTASTFFEIQLPKGVFIHFLQDMQKKAILLKQNGYEAKNQLFRSLCNLDNIPDQDEEKKEISHLRSLTLKTVNWEKSAQLESLYKQVKNRPELIAYCLKAYLYPSYRIQTDLLSMNGGKCIGILKGKLHGMTGTPDFYRTIAADIALYRSTGCNAIIQEALQDKSKVHPVVSMPYETAKALPIKKLFENNPKVRCVVDAGAFFKDIPTTKLIRHFCNYIKSDDKLTDIRCVIFFKKVEEGGRLVDAPFARPVGGKEENDQRLDSLDTDYLHATLHVKPGEYFAYLDETHKTGVDIAHNDDAEGVVTARWDTLFVHFLQAVMRMRKVVDGKQSVHIVYGGENDKALPKTVEAVLHILTKNQKKHSATIHSAAPSDLTLNHQYAIIYRALMAIDDEKKRRKFYEKHRKTFLMQAQTGVSKALLYPSQSLSSSQYYEDFSKQFDRHSIIAPQYMDPVLDRSKDTLNVFTGLGTHPIMQQRQNQEVEQQKEKEKENQVEFEQEKILRIINPTDYQPIYIEYANVIHHGRKWEHLFQQQDDVHAFFPFQWEGLFLSPKLLQTTREDRDQFNLQYNGPGKPPYDIRPYLEKRPESVQLAAGAVLFQYLNDPPQLYACLINGIEKEYLSRFLSQNHDCAVSLLSEKGDYLFGNDFSKNKQHTDFIHDVKRKLAFYNGDMTLLNNMKNPCFSPMDTRKKQEKEYVKYYQHVFYPIRLEPMTPELKFIAITSNHINALFSRATRIEQVDIVGLGLELSKDATPFIKQLQSELDQFYTARRQATQSTEIEAKRKQVINTLYLKGVDITHRWAVQFKALHETTKTTYTAIANGEWHPSFVRAENRLDDFSWGDTFDCMANQPFYKGHLYDAMRLQHHFFSHLHKHVFSDKAVVSQSLALQLAYYPHGNEFLRYEEARLLTFHRRFQAACNTFLDNILQDERDWKSEKEDALQRIKEDNQLASMPTVKPQISTAFAHFISQLTPFKSRLTELGRGLSSLDQKMLKIKPLLVFLSECGAQIAFQSMPLFSSNTGINKVLQCLTSLEAIEDKEESKEDNLANTAPTAVTLSPPGMALSRTLLDAVLSFDAKTGQISCKNTSSEEIKQQLLQQICHACDMTRLSDSEKHALSGYLDQFSQHCLQAAKTQLARYNPLLQEMHALRQVKTLSKEDWEETYPDTYPRLAERRFFSKEHWDTYHTYCKAYQSNPNIWANGIVSDHCWFQVLSREEEETYISQLLRALAINTCRTALVDNITGILREQGDPSDVPLCKDTLTGLRTLQDRLSEKWREDEGSEEKKKDDKDDEEEDEDEKARLSPFLNAYHSHILRHIHINDTGIDQPSSHVGLPFSLALPTDCSVAFLTQYVLKEETCFLLLPAPPNDEEKKQLRARMQAYTHSHFSPLIKVLEQYTQALLLQLNTPQQGPQSIKDLRYFLHHMHDYVYAQEDDKAVDAVWGATRTVYANACLGCEEKLLRSSYQCLKKAHRTFLKHILEDKKEWKSSQELAISSMTLPNTPALPAGIVTILKQALDACVTQLTPFKNTLENQGRASGSLDEKYNKVRQLFDFLTDCSTETAFQTMPLFSSNSGVKKVLALVQTLDGPEKVKHKMPAPTLSSYGMQLTRTVLSAVLHVDPNSDQLRTVPLSSEVTNKLLKQVCSAYNVTDSEERRTLLGYLNQFLQHCLQTAKTQLAQYNPLLQEMHALRQVKTLSENDWFNTYSNTYPRLAQRQFFSKERWQTYQQRYQECNNHPNIWEAGIVSDHFWHPILNSNENTYTNQLLYTLAINTYRHQLTSHMTRVLNEKQGPTTDTDCSQVPECQAVLNGIRILQACFSEEAGEGDEKETDRSVPPFLPHYYRAFWSSIQLDGQRIEDHPKALRTALPIALSLPPHFVTQCLTQYLLNEDTILTLLPSPVDEQDKLSVKTHIRECIQSYCSPLIQPLNTYNQTLLQTLNDPQKGPRCLQDSHFVRRTGLDKAKKNPQFFLNFGEQLRKCMHDCEFDKVTFIKKDTYWYRVLQDMGMAYMHTSPQTDHGQLDTQTHPFLSAYYKWLQANLRITYNAHDAISTRPDTSYKTLSVTLDKTADMMQFLCTHFQLSNDKEEEEEKKEKMTLFARFIASAKTHQQTLLTQMTTQLRTYFHNALYPKNPKPVTATPHPVATHFFADMPTQIRRAFDTCSQCITLLGDNIPHPRTIENNPQDTTPHDVFTDAATRLFRHHLIARLHAGQWAIRPDCVQEDSPWAHTLTFMAQCTDTRTPLAVHEENSERYHRLHTAYRRALLQDLHMELTDNQQTPLSANWFSIRWLDTSPTARDTVFQGMCSALALDPNADCLQTFNAKMRTMHVAQKAKTAANLHQFIGRFLTALHRTPPPPLEANFDAVYRQFTENNTPPWEARVMKAGIPILAMLFDANKIARTYQRCSKKWFNTKAIYTVIVMVLIAITAVCTCSYLQLLPLPYLGYLPITMTLIVAGSSMALGILGCLYCVAFLKRKHFAAFQQTRATLLPDQGNAHQASHLESADINQVTIAYFALKNSLITDNNTRPLHAPIDRSLVLPPVEQQTEQPSPNTQPMPISSENGRLS